MTSSRTSRRLALASVIVSLAGLAWWALTRIDREPIVVRVDPIGVMGTDSSLIAVFPPGESRRAERALAAAEGELRRLEAILSTWIDASELSALLRAPAGEEIALSAETREVLARAGQLHRKTAGAFDVTAAPLISGWREAAEAGRLPSAAELAALRAESTWEDLELTAVGAIKRRATLRLDVDGIAKGYAIDRALAVLRGAGALGGMVEVGGDLRAFGPAPGDLGWRVGVRDPSDESYLGLVADLRVEDAAVCTSGGYARFVEIDGVRYSHILDPRSGRPVDKVASVTVLAADAATADAWATALSVLGEEGLDGLDEGVEALLVFSGDVGPRVASSPGFPRLAPGPAGG